MSVRLLYLLLGCFLPPSYAAESDPASDATDFLPNQSVHVLREQHRRLPTDDIWWTRTGEDMAWNFKNLNQLFPTVTVHRFGAVSELASAPNPDIASYEVETPSGPMPFESFIESEYSTALGVVVVHRGSLVFERYVRMRDYEMPVYWSVAKAFVGMLVRILEERGQIEVNRAIDHYVPTLKRSSLAGIPIRALLDMASGLDCGDEYEDRTSCYYRYSMSIGDGFRTPDAPDNPYDFAAEFKAKVLAEPGTINSYSGFNTFVLGWLVEEVTGLPFQDVLAREVWRHLGAESHAAYIAPRYGIAVTHGGFIARMRDVARLGMLFTPSWRRVSEHPVVSAQHLEFLMSGGNPSLRFQDTLPAAKAPIWVDTLYQWDSVYPNGIIFKGGWAGQGLIINPRWDLVVVFTSYNKDDEASEMALEPVLWKMIHELYGP